MHILWAARMCQELDPELDTYPITIYNDNKSLITLVNQPIVNRQGRSKFINRSMFQVNENIAEGEVVIVYIFMYIYIYIYDRIGRDRKRL